MNATPGSNIPHAEGISRVTRGALECVRLDGSAATIEAAVQGAHLVSWRPAGERPVLFLSERSAFTPGKAIRGGVPLIFPWFGARAGNPAVPAHGFARVAPWRIRDAAITEDGGARLQFELTSEDAVQVGWTHRFLVHFDVLAGSGLTMRLTVQNNGETPLPFEAAFHTYFAVSDVRDVHILGLENTEYLDKTEDYARKTQDAAPIRFTRETDRMYLNTPAACAIVDPAWKRKIVISKQGSLATVVWNPWKERAEALSDLGEDQWLKMVCVESVIAAENSVVLAPGQLHELVAGIRLEGVD
ncbi:MAG: D-hexose-6-phosphate mutarotase [Opitutaceae bacterium]